MKTSYFMLLSFVVLTFGCQKEKKDFPTTLEDFREIEILKKEMDLEKRLEACESLITKNLCKQTWHINLPDLEQDTLFAKKDQSDDSFPINFNCDGSLYFEKPMRKERSSWDISNKSLDLKIEYIYSKSSFLNYSVDATYKIIKVDSILTLILNDRRRLEQTLPYVSCPGSIPEFTTSHSFSKGQKVTSKLLPDN